MAARLSRQEWAEQQAAKVAAAQEMLDREVAKVHSSEDWKRFLGLQAKLHRYSAGNVLLVWAQHQVAYAEGRVTVPEPGYVAGFRTWQALGRQVQKGQHGYAIFAPVRRTGRAAVDGDGNLRPLGHDEEPAPGEQIEKHTTVRGFRLETVFSMAQTTGVPLPEPPQPRLLEGEAPRGLGQAVMGMIEERGFTVATVPDPSHLNGANGVTRWGERAVLVRADVDDAAMVKTLIHEAGHVLLHDTPPGRYLPRARKEVEAESVAFVVAAAHGMATDGYSFPYVAAWAADATDPAGEVRATQARVAQAARTILELSPADHLAGGRVPGAEQAVEKAKAERARRPEPGEPAQVDALTQVETFAGWGVA